MKYFEIQVPCTRNDGKSYSFRRGKFEQGLLQYAGGYSKAIQDVEGVWQDKHGKVYREAMVPYRVACDAVAFEKILSAAFDLFDDQHAIFYAEIGEATIRNRVVPMVPYVRDLTPREKALQAAE